MTVKQFTYPFIKKTNLFFEANSLYLLRITMGVVFILFGFVKFYHGLSPAEGLAIKTMDKLTFNYIPGTVLIKILATWEVATGFGLLFNRFLKATMVLLILHLLGTFLPFLFFPNEMWKAFPFVFSMEGQYIVKNIVFIAAAIVLGTRKEVVVKKSQTEYLTWHPSLTANSFGEHHALARVAKVYPARGNVK